MMRLVQLRSADGPILATLDTNGALRSVADRWRTLPYLLTEAAGGSLAGLLAEASAGRTPQPWQLADLLAPVPADCRGIYATGWNYLDHFEEGATEREEQVAMPDHPTFFWKAPGSVLAPAAAIRCPQGLSTRWDYEAEVAIVIGVAGANIAEADALAHVAAYTLANDVTARDIQRRHGNQWIKGKSMDASSPIGPWLVPAEDIGDPAAIEFSCTVNGEVRQQATVAQMAFPIARLIAELSHGMTLQVGDVLLTGTPSGVGYAREPAQYLEPGDEVVVRSPQLGELRNAVVDAA